MRCVYLTTDLLFSSRVSGLAREHGVTLEVVGTWEAARQRVAAPDVRLVILDLNQAGLDVAVAAREIRSQFPAVTIVAYGPHVDEERLQSARQAGCHYVLPRSAFDRQIGALLGQAMTGEPSA